MSDEKDDDLAVMRIRRKLKERMVEVENNEGELEVLTLREMTGDARDKYLQKFAKRFKGDDLQDVVGMQSELICRCLWRGDKLVSEDEIKNYPSEAQTELWLACRKLNGIGQKNAEEEKNA